MAWMPAGLSPAASPPTLRLARKTSTEMPYSFEPAHGGAAAAAASPPAPSSGKARNSSSSRGAFRALAGADWPHEPEAVWTCSGEGEGWSLLCLMPERRNGRFREDHQDRLSRRDRVPVIAPLPGAGSMSPKTRILRHAQLPSFPSASGGDALGPDASPARSGRPRAGLFSLSYLNRPMVFMTVQGSPLMGGRVTPLAWARLSSSRLWAST